MRRDLNSFACMVKFALVLPVRYTFVASFCLRGLFCVFEIFHVNIPV